MVSNETFEEFRARVLKVSSPRQSKRTGTFSSKSLIRKIRRENPEAKCLSEDNYSRMIRRINELLIEDLFKGYPIELPYNMGNIAIYSRMGKIYKKDDKLVRTMPIDWNATLKLWHKDSKAAENATVVRNLPAKIYRIKYHTKRVGYKNQQYYKFIPCRTLKQQLKELLINNIDVPAYEHGIYID